MFLRLLQACRPVNMKSWTQKLIYFLIYLFCIEMLGCQTKAQLILEHSTFLMLKSSKNQKCCLKPPMRRHFKKNIILRFINYTIKVARGFFFLNKFFFPIFGDFFLQFWFFGHFLMLFFVVFLIRLVFYDLLKFLIFFLDF